MIDDLKYYEQVDNEGPQSLTAGLAPCARFVVPLEELIEAPDHNREHSRVITDFEDYCSA